MHTLKKRGAAGSQCRAGFPPEAGLVPARRRTPKTFRGHPELWGAFLCAKNPAQRVVGPIAAKGRDPEALGWRRCFCACRQPVFGFDLCPPEVGKTHRRLRSGPQPSPVTRLAISRRDRIFLKKLVRKGQA